MLCSVKLSEPNENVLLDTVTDNIFCLCIQSRYSFVIRIWSIRVLNGISIFHNLPQFYVDGLKSDSHSLFPVDIVISIEDRKSFKVRGSTCIQHTQNSNVFRPLINRDREYLLSYQLLGPRVYRPEGVNGRFKNSCEYFDRIPNTAAEIRFRRNELKQASY